MQKPDITVIIPHKSTPNNDKSLLINIQRLMEGSTRSLEIIIDTSVPKDPYKIWNEASASARADVLVFSNSDVIMAPGWDKFFHLFCVPNAIVTGYLVEAGNIGVHPLNIGKNCGKTPDEFNWKLFAEFVERHSKGVPDMREQRGWYMPCAVNKEWFLSTGGFDTTLGFPNPNDVEFWDRCIEKYNTTLLRVKSYAYHFQALSTRS